MERESAATIRTRTSLVIIFTMVLLCPIAKSAHADAADIHVAVASNFATTMRRLATVYQAETGFSLRFSSASTGKLYAQIKNGAPYDVFLSADDERAERLVDEDIGVRESLRTYATGQLVLVSNIATQVDLRNEPCDRLFYSDRVKRFAIANPGTAPYGLAAQQTLQNIGAWDQVRPKLVRGENISQAFQFVESGNAQAGFVAKSQLHSYAGENISKCRWDVPPDQHQPIEQKMVVLKASSEKPAVEAFENFIAGDLAAAIMEEFGY